MKWLGAALALLVVPALAHGQGPVKPAAKAAPAKAVVKGPVAASRIWHALPSVKTPALDPLGRPKLTLQALNTTDHVTMPACTEHGGFAADDLDRAAHVLRDTRTGNEHPVDPRVLDLVYRVAVHFAAPEVRIISGYRTPRNGTRSNHGKGRAIDLVVPGASDEEVAKFAREQGFVGVGVYPTSGFVHLDVRDRSYFWVDFSGPGKKNRTRGILGDVAAKSDARALARGDHPVEPFGLAFDVDAALAASSGASAPPNAQDDDDNDDAL